MRGRRLRSQKVSRGTSLPHSLERTMRKLGALLAGVGLLLFLFVPLIQAETQYEVGEVTYESHSDYTRVSIEVAPGTGYVAQPLQDPPRLKVNLYPANLVSVSKEIEVGDRFVERIRLDQESRRVVRVVLDLNISNATSSIDLSTDPSRVVIEIRGPQEDLVAAILKEKDSPIIRKEEFPPTAPALEREKAIYTIVLDPGHGGKDPGAIGRATGLEEKEITLEVAKEVARMLKNEAGIRVYLTRNTDRYLSLDRRTEIANQLGADMFISIHANSGYRRHAKGVETFFNSRYSYGEGAEEVAARENRPLGSENVPDEAKLIIWDLIQNAYRSESNDLAHTVQKELVQTTDGEDRGVKSAGFYVLRGAAMPAVLVEIGFLSNPSEERMLRKKDFREKIALGIVKGLKRYYQGKL